MDSTVLKQLNLERLDKNYVSILIVKEVMQQNQGTYQCKIGNKTKTLTLWIDENNFGYLSIYPKRLNVSESDSVEFFCHSAHQNEIKNKKIQWYFKKNGKLDKKYLNKSKWTIFNPSNADLTSFIKLENVTNDSNGVIQCKLPNGLIAEAELVVTKTVKIWSNVSKINVSTFQPFQFSCETNYGNIYVNINNTEQMHDIKVSQTDPKTIIISAPNGLRSNGHLEITCVNGNVEKNISINVKSHCKSNQKSCKNGQCIDSNKFCNGALDCSDHSDEDQNICNDCRAKNIACQYVNGQAPKRSFIDVSWLCDEADDCGNGYDELNCLNKIQKRKDILICNNMAIYNNAICDGIKDCYNGEDERDCETKIISISNDQKVSKGEKVIIKCEVKSKPKPIIRWLHNGNCVKNPNIYEMEKGNNIFMSTLVIKKLSNQNEGIYQCFILSNKRISNEIKINII